MKQGTLLNFLRLTAAAQQRSRAEIADGEWLRVADSDRFARMLRALEIASFEAGELEDSALEDDTPPKLRADLRSISEAIAAAVEDALAPTKQDAGHG
jgi:hypothetical protein